MSKYRAQKTTLDGIAFDSKGEAQRYAMLKLEQRAGLISDLELQPEFEFKINGEKICKYKADFRYVRDGETVVEDFKGMKTPLYRIKAKMFRATYGFAVTETTKADL